MFRSPAATARQRLFTKKPNESNLVSVTSSHFTLVVLIFAGIWEWCLPCRFVGHATTCHRSCSETLSPSGNQDFSYPFVSLYPLSPPHGDGKLYVSCLTDRNIPEPTSVVIACKRTQPHRIVLVFYPTQHHFFPSWFPISKQEFFLP